MRFVLVAISLSIMSLSTAFAQELTAEQRAACTADYEKFCKGTMPGGGRIIACLGSHPITDACKKVLATAKPQ